MAAPGHRRRWGLYPWEEARASSIHPSGHSSPESSPSSSHTPEPSPTSLQTLALLRPAVPAHCVPRASPTPSWGPGIPGVPHSTPTSASQSQPPLLPHPGHPSANTAGTLPSRILPTPAVTQRHHLQHSHCHPLPFPPAGPASFPAPHSSKRDKRFPPHGACGLGGDMMKREQVQQREVWEEDMTEL